MFKRFFLNILYAGQANLQSADVRKQILINSSFNLVSFFLLFYFGLRDLGLGNFVLGFIVLAAALINGLNFFYLRYSGNYKNASLLTIIVFVGLCLYLLASGGQQNTGPLWFYILPNLIFYVLGFHRGRIVLGLLLLCILAILFVPGNPILHATYSIDFALRFFFSFLSLGIVSYAYEYTREDGKRELLAMSRKLDTLARQDTLTGLSNRRDMLEKLEHEIDRMERSQKIFCVLLLDIDHFKNVNDNYSHGGGDYVLTEVARILSSSTQKRDSVARWGGEEFLILLPETTLSQAATTAERLRRKIEENRFSYKEKLIKITISVGGAQYQKGTNIDNLLHNADEMLYRAKNGGRNRVKVKDEK